MKTLASRPAAAGKPPWRRRIARRTGPTGFRAHTKPVKAAERPRALTIRRFRESSLTNRWEPDSGHAGHGHQRSHLRRESAAARRRWRHQRRYRHCWRPAANCRAPGAAARDRAASRERRTSRMLFDSASYAGAPQGTSNQGENRQTFDRSALIFLMHVVDDADVLIGDLCTSSRRADRRLGILWSLTALSGRWLRGALPDAVAPFLAYLGTRGQLLRVPREATKSYRQHCQRWSGSPQADASIVFRSPTSGEGSKG